MKTGPRPEAGGGYVAAVAILAVVLLFAGLGAAPFDDPGEGMHAEIARELTFGSDPFALRLNGVPYVDKPPLLYWLIAGAFRALGPTEAAARAVSALAGLLAVLAVMWLGWHLLEPFGAMAAGLMLLTSVGFFVYARYVRPESLLVATLAWGFALLLVGIQRGRRGLAAGGLAAFGAASLAKDLMAAVAPVLVIAATMLVTGQWRPRDRWLPGQGVAAGLFLAFGWYLAVERRVPGFVWYTVVDVHILNIAGARVLPDEDVPLGAIEFLGVAALGAAPWTLAGLACLVDLGRRRAWRERGELPWVILAAWVMAVFIATAASQFRLPHYGLPAYPAIALLAARAWLRGSGRALVFLTAAGFALLASAGWMEVARGGTDFLTRVVGAADVYTRKEVRIGEPLPLPPWEALRPLVMAAAGVCSGASLALIATGLRGARRAALVVTIAAMLGMLPLAAWAHSMVSAQRSVRRIAAEVQRHLGPGDQLLHEGPIENSGAIEFYAGVRPIIVEGRRSVLAFGATLGDSRDRFWDTARLGKEWTRPRRLFLLTPRTGPSSVVGTLPPERVRLLAEIDSRRLYVNEPSR